MNFWHSLAGGLDIELRSADPARAMTALQDKGITLRQVRFLDELTARFTVSRLEWRRIRLTALKRGFEVGIREKLGLYWILPELLRRPVLLVGMALLIGLGLYLPSRVLFVQVEGNQQVASRRILEAAAQCGIHFGASRREVRSERMKNALLEGLPELQWAGVNTSGCVAVISVRERQTPVQARKEEGVGSIVAKCDAVITEMTAIRGNPLCKPGQAVKAGQVLISGYTDCGLTIRAVQARGEVYGKTQRELEAVCPVIWENRGVAEGNEEKYSLILGKKRINLYFGSGILPSSCVKIYEECYLTLPGGFILPAALVKEVWQVTKTDTFCRECPWLSQAAQAYLVQEMTAGQIQAAREDISCGGELWELSGRYACLEMIGQLRKEEIIKPNGTND